MVINVGLIEETTIYTVFQGANRYNNMMGYKVVDSSNAKKYEPKMTFGDIVETNFATRLLGPDILSFDLGLPEKHKTLDWCVSVQFRPESRDAGISIRCQEKAKGFIENRLEELLRHYHARVTGQKMSTNISPELEELFESLPEVPCYYKDGKLISSSEKRWSDQEEQAIREMLATVDTGMSALPELRNIAVRCLSYRFGVKLDSDYLIRLQKEAEDYQDLKEKKEEIKSEPGKESETGTADYHFVGSEDESVRGATAKAKVKPPMKKEFVPKKFS